MHQFDKKLSGAGLKIGRNRMARILVIDDQQAIRFMIRRSLEREGHEVAEAGDGEEGIERFRQSPVDLVVTDIHMPRRDGLEVIKELRSHFPDVKIIALSGNPRETIAAATHLGPGYVFIKPFSIKEFLVAVDKMLGDRPERAVPAVKLSTLGYQRWPAKTRLDGILQTLKKAGVNTLIDIRISPCSVHPESDPPNARGPRDWNLQPGDRGIALHLKEAGIDYRWLPELGNPQKNDGTMAVLRDHIASENAAWPVNRGLILLRNLVQSSGKQCCLLCACEDPETCHRRLVTEALNDRFFEGALEVSHL